MDEFKRRPLQAVDQRSYQSDIQKLLKKSFKEMLWNFVNIYRLCRLFVSSKKTWCITFLDGTTLAKVEEFKYLGLWLDSQLSFKTNNSMSNKDF